MLKAWFTDDTNKKIAISDEDKVRLCEEDCPCGGCGAYASSYLITRGAQNFTATDAYVLLGSSFPTCGGPHECKWGALQQLHSIVGPIQCKLIRADEVSDYLRWRVFMDNVCSEWYTKNDGIDDPVGTYQDFHTGTLAVS